MTRWAGPPDIKKNSKFFRMMSWNCPWRSSALYVPSEINHILQDLALLDYGVVIILYEEILHGMRPGESAVHVK